MKNTIRLGATDNVVVATRHLEVGERIEADPGSAVEIQERIPRGHKVAVDAIPAGSAVRKYDEVIGIATADISPGEHVHVHVVQSARLPGEEGDN